MLKKGVTGGGFVKASRKKRKTGLRLLAVGLVLLGAILLVDMRVRPIILKTSSYQSNILATRIINQAVFDELNNETYDYSSLVTLTSNASGEIMSIESNMLNINRLKTQCTQLINEAVKNIEQHDLGITLGTISGIHMLYGQGPMVPIKVAPKGYANTVLISSFSSAGINQTLHQIIMEITLDISAIIPGYTSSVQVVTNFVVAETVIIGTVPEAYTHIISGVSDLVGEINDYKAENYL